MSSKFYVACLLIFVGHVLAWYQTYSPHVWDWCKQNIVFIPLIFSIPTGYLFLYGMKFAIEEMDEVWGPRLLAFGLSYLVFPFLTYWYFNESMFEVKTLLCIFLSFLIVAIQVFWK
tara:strand:+ start:791 stop:1138 length:348 start_codon:yes stop_codon:yes gene_type:complete